MRRQNLFFMVMLITTLVMAGCESTPKQNNRTTPDWFDEQPPSNVFWGIGFAKLQNSSLAMETAAARAQRDVARQLGTLVQASLVDYAKEIGLDSNTRTMSSIENVGRNIINMDLSNTTVNKRTQMNDGTWWVRVSYSKADAQKLAREEVSRVMADDVEFNKDKGLERVNDDLNRYKPTPDRR
jgi:hypothetical protein